MPLEPLIQQAKLDPASLSPGDAQQLQHTIGNQAVRQLFQSHAPSQPRHEIKNNTGLPDRLKNGVEILSGLSMNDVKVHYNSGKPAQLQALAYTQGTDIHIASGQEKHLPHEAWHVVQQKQSRVPSTIQAMDVAINTDTNLEREADVMGAKSSTIPLNKRLKLEHTKLNNINSETQPIQGVFTLTKTYKPNRDDIKVVTSFGANTTLEQGKNYKVTGFDFNGNVILRDEIIGIDYLIKNDQDILFTEVAVAPLPPQRDFIGFFEATASSWKPQIFKNGCWLATMAVLANKTQEQLQKQVDWPNEAFFGMLPHELIEFSQMINCQVEEIKKDDVNKIYDSLNAGKPVIYGILNPEHVMLIFAITSEKDVMKLWDPANGSIQVVPTNQVINKCDRNFIKK